MQGALERVQPAKSKFCKPKAASKRIGSFLRRGSLLPVFSRIEEGIPGLFPDRGQFPATFPDRFPERFLKMKVGDVPGATCGSRINLHFAPGWGARLPDCRVRFYRRIPGARAFPGATRILLPAVSRRPSRRRVSRSRLIPGAVPGSAPGSRMARPGAVPGLFPDPGGISRIVPGL